MPATVNTPPMMAHVVVTKWYLRPNAHFKMVPLGLIECAPSDRSIRSHKQCTAK